MTIFGKSAVGAVQEIADFLRQTALQMTIQESL